MSDANSSPEEDKAPADLVEKIRWMKARDYDLDALYYDGSTMLMMAACCGNMTALRLLVEDYKVIMDVIATADGLSALDLAMYYDQREAAKYLWLAGAALTPRNRPDSGGVEWVRPYIEKGPPSRSNHGMTSHGESTIYIACGNSVPLDLDTKRVLDAYKARKLLANRVHQVVDFHRLDFSKSTSIDWSLQHNIDKSSTILLDTSQASDEVSIDPNNSIISKSSPSDVTQFNIKSSTPFTVSDKISYYEMTLLEPVVGICVAIGLAGKADSLVNELLRSPPVHADNESVLKEMLEPMRSDYLPGWLRYTCGYHSDDGRAHSAADNHDVWARKYFSGDVIGCGIVWSSQEVFYTLNGAFLGVASHGLDFDSYYACIGIQASSCRLKVNFGTEPFAFNLRVNQFRWETLTPPLVEYPVRHPHTLHSYFKYIIMISRGPFLNSIHVYSSELGKWIDPDFSDSSLFPTDYVPSERFTSVIEGSSIICVDPLGTNHPCTLAKKTIRIWEWELQACDDKLKFYHKYIYFHPRSCSVRSLSLS